MPKCSKTRCRLSMAFIALLPTIMASVNDDTIGTMSWLCCLAGVGNSSGQRLRWTLLSSWSEVLEILMTMP
jgi:hypothetical protein